VYRRPVAHQLAVHSRRLWRRQPPRAPFTSPASTSSNEQRRAPCAAHICTASLYATRPEHATPRLWSTPPPSHLTSAAAHVHLVGSPFAEPGDQPSSSQLRAAGGPSGGAGGASGGFGAAGGDGGGGVGGGEGGGGAGGGDGGGGEGGGAGGGAGGGDGGGVGGGGEGLGGGGEGGGEGGGGDGLGGGGLGGGACLIVEPTTVAS